MINHAESLGIAPEPEPFVEQSNANSEPFVLVVEPLLEWRKFWGNTLKKAGIRYEVVPSARVAIEKLDLEQEDQFTAVITDGLQGAWTGIVELAREKGAEAVLTAKSSLTVGEARRNLVPAFLKNDLKDKHSGALAGLLFAVAPDVKLENKP